MLKAKIDATTYPVIRVESIERPVVSTHALHPLMFEPTPKQPNWQLYFKELEDE